MEQQQEQHVVFEPVLRLDGVEQLRNFIGGKWIDFFVKIRSFFLKLSEFNAGFAGIRLLSTASERHARSAAIMLRIVSFDRSRAFTSCSVAPEVSSFCSIGQNDRVTVFVRIAATNCLTRSRLTSVIG